MFDLLCPTFPLPSMCGWIPLFLTYLPHTSHWSLFVSMINHHSTGITVRIVFGQMAATAALMHNKNDIHSIPSGLLTACVTKTSMREGGTYQRKRGYQFPSAGLSTPCTDWGHFDKSDKLSTRGSLIKPHGTGRRSLAQPTRGEDTLSLPRDPPAALPQCNSAPHLGKGASTPKDK